MDERGARATARVRHCLTASGHRRLLDAFMTFTGERRKFGSVSELDARTVARIYYNLEPFDLVSLMVLFRALKLELQQSDYTRASRKPAEHESNVRSLGGHGTAPAGLGPLSVEDGHPGAHPAGACSPGAGVLGDETAYLLPDDEVASDGGIDGGAEVLASRYYIERPADAELKVAIRRRASTILLKGPRHCGKSSLLARALQEARGVGFQTACTDFDALDADRLGSRDSLCRALAGTLAMQCGADRPGAHWDSDYTPSENLEIYLRQFLRQNQKHLVWAMDGVDALIGCGFHEEIFGMFRAWHNARSYEPGGPWDRITLVLSYATEASLLISSDKESPFNVGTTLYLGDFASGEASELNRRYECPLDRAEEERLFTLCGGHPFLTRLALAEITSGRNDLTGVESAARLDGGIYRPYLDEIREVLKHDTEYRALVAAVAAARPIAASPEINRCFHRLRSAGILKREHSEAAAFRCDLYCAHFTRYPL